MRIRSWSVRNKIIALLLVPLVSLAVLWAVATSMTIGTVLELGAARTYHDRVWLPGDKLVAELQQERMLSVVYLGGGRALPKPLADQRIRTDAALVTFRRLASTEDAADAVVQQRIRVLLNALGGLSTARETIDSGELDRAGAMRLYTGMVDAAYRLFAALVDLDDRELARYGRAVVAFGHAREVSARENALLAGGAAAGRLSVVEQSQLVQAIGVQRELYEDAVADLPDADRLTYRRLARSENAVRLRAAEDRLVAESRAGAPVAVDMAQWRATYDAVAGPLRDLELTSGRAAIERTGSAADRALAQLWLAGLVGLVAVTLSVGYALWLDRSLVGGLNRLRTDALDLALTRLPAVVGRLRRGEDVDMASEAPLLPYGADELGQVGHAFNEVQRRAVESAVAEARLRQGINEVFLSIAERGQLLLHRQLALLDDLERRITEPTDLADLFQLDHLATQLRRHAEGLVILAGSVPGRGWRSPVPMVDVIRGAVSEVDGYPRVTTRVGADAALVGRVVADTIHLLAELIENATSHSPPQSGVRVTGDLVPNGFAIEVEDRGRGMDAEEIAQANRQLAEPPEFDATTGARLGLFVVARLAAPHGIGVHLRTSPYGGITAVVLIPPELVAVAPDDAPSDPAPAAPDDPPADPAPVAPDDPPADPAPVAPDDPPSDPAPAAPDDPPSDPTPADWAGTVGLPHRPERRMPAGPEPGPRPGTALDPPPEQRVPTATGLLPRRTRQASLTPQLRHPDPPSTPEGQSAVSLTGPARASSPDEIRSRLSAFQEGITRGRQEPLSPDDGRAVTGGGGLAGGRGEGMPE